MRTVGAFLIALAILVAGLFVTKEKTGLDRYLPHALHDTRVAVSDFINGEREDQRYRPVAMVLQESADGILFCLTWYEAGDTCVTRERLREIAREPLMESQPVLRLGQIQTKPKPMKVDLVHPTDMSADPATVTDCATFNRLKSDGWGGLTSRDMARERQFIKRCGLFSMAERATMPSVTYFKDGKMSEVDIKKIPSADWPYIGEPMDRPSLKVYPGTSARTYKKDDRFHIAEYGIMRTLMSEVSHADFNGDGRADMLVLLSGAPADGGTARVAMYCLVEKDANGNLRMVPAELYKAAS